MYKKCKPFHLTHFIIMNLSSRKSIIELLRAKSGGSIARFAKNNHVSRQSVYEAMAGNGARRIRIEIAKTIGLPPSMLWRDNNNAIKVIDDLHYIGCGHD